MVTENGDFVPRKLPVTGILLLLYDTKCILVTVLYVITYTSVSDWHRACKLSLSLSLCFYSTKLLAVTVFTCTHTWRPLHFFLSLSFFLFFFYSNVLRVRYTMKCLKEPLYFFLLFLNKILLYAHIHWVAHVLIINLTIISKEKSTSYFNVRLREGTHVIWESLRNNGLILSNTFCSNLNVFVNFFSFLHVFNPVPLRS